MPHFGALPRFEVLGDGTLVVRAGTQTNSGGIASARVRITRTEERGLECSVAPPSPAIGPSIPGAHVPQAYRDALFAGAREAYAERAVSFGLHLELVDALVHPVDANERRFREAGRSAIEGWLGSQSR